jgi:hypothetical protein
MCKIDSKNTIETDPIIADILIEQQRGIFVRNANKLRFSKIARIKPMR